MNNMFSEKEIAVFKAWLSHKKNKEIADELGVSESYISQTLTKIKMKINTLENSFDLLQEMGVINSITPLKLTDKGRASLKERKSKLETKIRPSIAKAEKIQSNSELIPSVIPQETIVGVHPVFHSPHEILRYTITELIQAIISPKFMESTHKLATRLGLAEDIIEAARLTVNQSLTKRSVIEPTTFGLWNYPISNQRNVWSTDPIATGFWVGLDGEIKPNPSDTIDFDKPYTMETGLEKLVNNALQFQTNSKNKPGKFLTASNVEGSMSYEY